MTASSRISYIRELTPFSFLLEFHSFEVYQVLDRSKLCFPPLPSVQRLAAERHTFYPRTRMERALPEIFLANVVVVNLGCPSPTGNPKPERNALSKHKGKPHCCASSRCCRLDVVTAGTADTDRVVIEMRHCILSV